jgi:hypothetical protein
LLLRQGNPYVLAQDTGAATGDKPTSLNWETVKGIRVLRAWQIEGRNTYPQISLLWVSTSDFQKFLHDPGELHKFVNEQKVFSKDVLTVGPWVTLSAVDETDDKAGYFLTLVHTSHSRMTVSALPANPDLQPLPQK